jgi:hypothetical protein
MTNSKNTYYNLPVSTKMTAINLVSVLIFKFIFINRKSLFRISTTFETTISSIKTTYYNQLIRYSSSTMVKDKKATKKKPAVPKEKKIAAKKKATKKKNKK